MNPLLLIAALLGLALAVMAVADEPRNGIATVDAAGGLILDAKIPAGSRSVSLEISPDLSAPSWRPMIAGTLDGRVARVTFRLPPQGGARVFARVRASTATSPPPVELTDPDLLHVAYGEPVPMPVKVSLLNAAGAKMREWQGLPRAQYLANLVAWAEADPDVEDAYVSEEGQNVCIRFRDGNLCVLLNKPRTSADAGNEMPRNPPPPAAAALAPAMAPRSVAIGGIPGANRAVTAFSLENGYPNSAPTIGNWLSRRGYQTTVRNGATLDDVMSWSGKDNPLGVLFWHAHGCTFDLPDGTKSVGLVTRQITDHRASFPIYTQMFDNGELMMAKDITENLPVWGITSKFVRNRMRFAPHSLVVMDACDGANADMADAFLDAGAGSYVSWDWLSGDHSGTPCLKIFDRLLGMNQEPPVSSPPERSFSMAAVQQWMTDRGYDYDPSPKYKDQPRPNARLVWYHNPSAPANILMPSIMRVLAEAAYPNENYSKYLIEGDFGPDPGIPNRTVLWGGREMQVVRWDALNGIVIRIPRNPPQGEIQVVLKKDFYSLSNKRPITQWTVPFNYQILGEGSLAAVMDLSVKFRGDILGSRYFPEMPVQYLGVTFNNMADCSGTVAASGMHQPSEGVTVTWYGGSSISSRDPNEGGPLPVTHVVNNSGVLTPASSRPQMFALNAHGTFTGKTRITGSDGSVHEEVGDLDMVLDAFHLFYADPPRFNPSTGAMSGGTRQFSPEAKLSWPVVFPAFPPADTTPR